MNTYSGVHSDQEWYQVSKNGEGFDPSPSLAIVNHSPDGFSWGYGGSGPNQLGFAILLEEVGQMPALQYYRQFTQEVIAHLSNEWTLTTGDITEWIGTKVKKKYQLKCYLKLNSAICQINPGIHFFSGIHKITFFRKALNPGPL